jgi:iron complex transport system substrate-binding protein
MDKKYYLLTILIIAALITSAFLALRVNQLQTTLDTQANQLTLYNQQLSNQQTQLEIFTQTINTQNDLLNQYNQTMIQQNTELERTRVITVVDDEGYVVTLTSPPERIVSLAPSNTEILFAVGAGDQVVGVTNYCDYPYNFSAWVAAGNMSSIGSYWQPAIEPIIALNPDLVIGSGGGASDEAASKLRNLGYTVLLLDAKNLNDVLDDIYLVGQATNHSDQAASLVSSLRTRIDTVTNKVANATTIPKVYDEVSDDPLMAAGPNTFIDDLITLAGGQNIFDDASSQWPIVSSDSIISKNPDVILSPFSDLSSRAGWSSISAVINNQIYNEGSDSSYVRPGPRLVDALEELSLILHPEIFGSP